MSLKKITKMPTFWKSVAMLSIMFIIIYNIINLGFSFGFDTSAFAESNLQQPYLFRFLAANLVGGFLYGFIMTYFKFKSRLKEEEKRNAS
ncbi:MULTISPECIES: hypothetical protein [Mesonia]|jgi:hypothetical protein|uniref:Uncharacterized protein n=1 Tax=Mesonia algae TaxID=213248 RepID=A0A2W7I5E6_9FLAO|nr:MULTISPECIES: hypothetical protein [Mesonia]PZW41429.1 hypothetical protein LX95_01104 [Mesonia algae]TXK77062.1 hypothetical protein FT986_05095 [Mesonia sp. K4-1]